MSLLSTQLCPPTNLANDTGEISVMALIFGYISFHAALLRFFVGRCGGLSASFASIREGRRTRRGLMSGVGTLCADALWPGFGVLPECAAPAKPISSAPMVCTL